MGTPRNKAVGCDVARKRPSTGSSQMSEASLEQLHVFRSATEGNDVSCEIRHVLGKRLLGGITLKARRDEAGTLSLSLGDKLGELSFGYLTVGRVQGRLCDPGLACQLKTGAVKAINLNLSVGAAAAWFVDVG
jgi:hypothetical protein